MIDPTTTRAVMGVLDDTPGMVRAQLNQQQQANKPPGVPTNHDIVDDIEGTVFSLPVNIGLFAGPMALGWLATGADKVGATGAAKGMRGVKDLTYTQLGAIPGVGAVGRGIAGVGTGLTNMALAPLKWVGADQMLANHYARSAEKHAGYLVGAADRAAAHASTISHSGLQNAVNEVRQHLAAGPHAIQDFEAFEKSLENATGLASRFGHKGLSKELGVIGKSATKFELARDFSAGWRNTERAVAGAVPKMASAGVWHGLLQGTFIVGAAASDYHTIKDLSHAMADLKSMYCGITREKPDDVSAWSLLVGKVPAPVAAARAEMLKEFGPAAVLDAANTVLNFKAVAHHKYLSVGKNMIALLALPMANIMVARGLLGSSILPAYGKIRDAQKAGQPATPEDYAKLIGNASAELHKLGGETSNFTKALANFYAQHQASADSVMQEIESGAVKKRMAALEQAYNAYAREHPEQAAAAENDAHPANGHGHGHGHGQNTLMGQAPKPGAIAASVRPHGPVTPSEVASKQAEPHAAGEPQFSMGA